MQSYNIVFNDELYHHGILGQKWGIRRYQNEDGTLTEEGKKRYGKHNDDTKQFSKTMAEYVHLERDLARAAQKSRNGNVLIDKRTKAYYEALNKDVNRRMKYLQSQGKLEANARVKDGKLYVQTIFNDEQLGKKFEYWDYIEDYKED